MASSAWTSVYSIRTCAACCWTTSDTDVQVDEATAILRQHGLEVPGDRLLRLGPVGRSGTCQPGVVPVRAVLRHDNQGCLT